MGSTPLKMQVAYVKILHFCSPKHFKLLFLLFSNRSGPLWHPKHIPISQKSMF